MAKERYKLISSIYLAPIRSNKVLLARRCNTGYEDGNYGLVAGHLEAEESVTQGMIREAKEEAGIILKPENLKVVHTMHRRENDERIDVFFTASEWEGEPTITEPDKCDDLGWFSLKKLPSNTIPYIRQAVFAVRDSIPYSEWGWG
jgi:ADP-ribose pyrophosphatase YjhB (NUDIX family)